MSLSKFIWWSPSTQCVDIWRWGLWEVIRFRWGQECGALMIELVFSEEEMPESLLCLSHRPPPRPHGNQWESDCLQARRRISPEPNHAGTLIADFWPAEQWENNCLLLRHSCYRILLWQSKLRLLWPWQFWGELIKYFVGCLSIWISLMFFSGLDGDICLGEQDHRGKVPLLS